MASWGSGGMPRRYGASGRRRNRPGPDRLGAAHAARRPRRLRSGAAPAATMREVARVVRPGGTVASLELLVPRNPVWRGCWWLHTRLLLPAAGALFGRGWFEVGRFLGPSISGHYRRHPLEW